MLPSADPKFLKTSLGCQDPVQYPVIIIYFNTVLFCGLNIVSNGLHNNCVIVFVCRRNKVKHYSLCYYSYAMLYALKYHHTVFKLLFYIRFDLV